MGFALNGTGADWLLMDLAVLGLAFGGEAKSRLFFDRVEQRASAYRPTSGPCLKP